MSIRTTSGIFAALLLTLSLSGTACLTDEGSAGSDASAGPEPLDKPIPMDPENLESMYFAAQQEFLAGNFEKSEKIYRDITFSDGKNPRVWHALGDVHIAMLNFREAMKDFGRAVKLDPEKRMSWMRLGVASQKSGEFLKAVEAFRQAQKMNPDDAQAFRMEALALVPIGRLDDSVAAYGKAIELEKDDARKIEDLKAMSDLQIRQEKYGEAAEALRKAIAISATAENYALLAEAELKAGNFAEVKKAYEAAARLDTKDPFYWEAVAEVCRRLKDVVGARDAYRESLKVQDRAHIHLNLAQMALDADDKDSARSELDGALKVTQGEAAEIQNAAIIAGKLGDMALAEKLYTTLVGAADMEDQVALWNYIAALRKAQGNEEGVAIACSSAKKEFRAKLTTKERNVFDSAEDARKNLDAGYGEEAAQEIPPIPDNVTADDYAKALDMCHVAVERDRQGAAVKALTERTGLLCERADKMRDILSKGNEDPLFMSKLAKREGKTGARPQGKDVMIPVLPRCPAEEVPWNVIVGSDDASDASQKVTKD